MKASEVLREARNVLFERGWYQGGMIGDDGTVCSLAAIDLATGDGWVFHNDTLRHFVNASGAKWNEIGLWNDNENRTFSEVIDAFDKAEKIAEAAESDVCADV